MKGAPVTNPLAAVKCMNRCGHTVVFDDEGSFIYNKETGEVNWMRDEEDGIFADRDVEMRGIQAVAEGEVGEAEGEIIEKEGKRYTIQLARDPDGPQRKSAMRIGW